MKSLISLYIGLVAIMSLMSCQPTGDLKVDEQFVLSQISEPLIPDYRINVIDFGAKGDSVSDNKAAFDNAIQELKNHRGGTLNVPAGIYLINGPLHLVSNSEIHLDKDAVLRFGSNPCDYLPVVKTSWEGTLLYNYSPFIFAYQCENIAITGEGTIDGEASETWAKWSGLQKADQMLSRDYNHQNVAVEKRIFGEGHFLRPHFIQFYDCKNIKIEDVKIEDSPFWCVHLLMCENVIVRGVRYDAQNKNNDGIDPEYSRNILIENVHFNNADDNIAIKAGRDDEGRAIQKTSENIIIRNCHFKGLHAVVIGSEMSAGVRNVFIRDCDFAGKLKRGLYLKSNPDRGGFITDIYMKNVRFGEVEDCIYITSFYHNEGQGHVTDISDVYIDSVSCRKATGTGVVIQGYADKKVCDIYINQLVIDSVQNAISFSNTEKIVMSDVVIGKLAGTPSSVEAGK